MKYEYEKISWGSDLSVRISIHSVEDFKMYCKNQIEILLVLKGELSVGLKEEFFLLKEDDIILINPNQLHTFKKTDESNILISIKINPSFYHGSFIEYKEIDFNSSNLDYSFDGIVKINEVRALFAEIVFVLQKESDGFKFKVGSLLYSLGEILLNNFEYRDQDKSYSETDTVRLQRIIDFVNKNYQKNLSLKELAENENLNYFYLSHFIKDKLGLTFKKYVSQVRINEALRQLLDTDKSIIDISNSSGFPNISSFNTLFKETFDTTPSVYRKDHKDALKVKLINNDSLEAYNVLEAFVKLETYLNYDENLTLSKVERSIPIKVDSKTVGETFFKHWQKIATFGRAKEALGASWQKQFIEFQNEFNFEYIRFHGIFADDMEVYNETADGKVYYNWAKVNELFDFFLENNIKPYIELSFVPSLLKSSDQKIYFWEGYISLPKDLDKWTALLKDFLNHCIKRYGSDEVNSWYFEVWKQPDFEKPVSVSKRKRQFEYFKRTFKAIKSVSSKIKVGGPAISMWSLSTGVWFSKFIEFLSKENLEIDFISNHTFSEYTPTDSLAEAHKLVLNYATAEEILKVLKTKFHNKSMLIETVERLIEAKDDFLDDKVEVIVSTWGFVVRPGHLISDTSFYATNIINTMISTINTADAIAYWSFSDLVEDYGPFVGHFHGGVGMINRDGIKKPSYNAFLLLSKLGNKVISTSNNHIITKAGEDVQVLIYNHAELEDDFINGSFDNITNLDRYGIFKPKDDLEIDLNIKDLKGKYKVVKYRLDRDHGSVFDEWLKLGGPEDMSKQEIDYLKEKSKPNSSIVYLDLDGEYSEKISVPVHGVYMVTLQRLD